MNLAEKPLAMAYVPWQKFENVLECGTGLAHGTIFEDLIFPFMGAQAGCQAPKMSRRMPPNHSMYQSPPQNCPYGRRGDCL